MSVLWDLGSALPEMSAKTGPLPVRFGAFTLALESLTQTRLRGDPQTYNKWLRCCHNPINP